MVKNLTNILRDLINTHLYCLWITAVFLLFFGIALITAWIGDDCLISARTIFNFINGYGLTWNFEQRVMAFTHPTWLFLLTGFVFVSGEFFYTTLIVSVFFSIGSIFMLIKYHYLFNQKQNLYVLLTPLLFLSSSQAYTDYMTSGLENPLSYFLIGIIVYLSEKIISPSKYSLTDKEQKRYLMSVFLLLALLFLNRMDYAVLVLPLGLQLLFLDGFKNKSWKKIELRAVLPAFIIIISWFIFSVIYFGSPLPNTFYAKLQAGYPLYQIYERGVDFYYATFKNDPITLLIIILGVITGLFNSMKLHRNLAAGMILYALYILHAGGDFMLGRFFAILAYIALFNIINFLSDTQLNKKQNLKTSYLIFLVTYLALFFLNLFFYSLILFKKGSLSDNIIEYSSSQINLIFIFFNFILGALARIKLQLFFLIGLLCWGLYIIYTDQQYLWTYWLVILTFTSSFIFLFYLGQFQWKQWKHLCEQQNFVKYIFSGWFIILLINLPVLFNLKDNQLRLGRLGISLGIANERLAYFPRYGLLSKKRKWPTPAPPPNTKPLKAQTRKKLEFGASALTQPHIYWIDRDTLADAFLSRLPAKQSKNWRIGHHKRKIPEGYADYLVHGTPIKNKLLQPLLDDVSLVISGDLFTKKTVGCHLSPKYQQALSNTKKLLIQSKNISLDSLMSNRV